MANSLYLLLFKLLDVTNTERSEVFNLERSVFDLQRSVSNVHLTIPFRVSTNNI